jgi:UDP-N-acetylglucosamine diphosphorylase / glucose-1-phosphate thymidylyltransferase / UDP-N-acetylgalactosamine diphosphorylase / glucosamine-1-phosphate N-acetyltransferase / galactosamine-1-phosphate N-acetyltransferase
MLLMIKLHNFIHAFPLALPDDPAPWLIPQQLAEALYAWIKEGHVDYHISQGIAIHKTAVVEEGVILKPPVIISAKCFIAAHAYLRGGVFLDKEVKIGPGCEIKSSVLAANTAIAHFNFVGDSLIGSQVNMEAGALTANHHNDRDDKHIFIHYMGQCIKTGVEKFGALIGDNARVGANTVLSPGTVLTPGTIVPRLALIDQSK